MTSRAVSLRVFAVFLLFSACGRGPADSETATAPAVRDDPRAPSRPVAATSGDLTDAPVVIFLGDSLTAGLGLDLEDSFPAVIQQRLLSEGYRYRVVNAGVSGDTSAGGLRRLAWAMGDGKPEVLIVALGGNDGLRGLSPEQLEGNLASIIEQAQARNMKVILAGMEAPPNFGADYTSRFRRVYPTLAAKYQVRLIPFLLEGVAGMASLNQADGIHPNHEGARRVSDLVWTALQPELVRTTAAPAR